MHVVLDLASIFITAYPRDWDEDGDGGSIGITHLGLVFIRRYI